MNRIAETNHLLLVGLIRMMNDPRLTQTQQRLARTHAATLRLSILRGHHA